MEPGEESPENLQEIRETEFEELTSGTREAASGARLSLLHIREQVNFKMKDLPQKRVLVAQTSALSKKAAAAPASTQHLLQLPRWPLASSRRKLSVGSIYKFPHNKRHPQTQPKAEAASKPPSRHTPSLSEAKSGVGYLSSPRNRALTLKSAQKCSLHHRHSYNRFLVSGRGLKDQGVQTGQEDPPLYPLHSPSNLLLERGRSSFDMMMRRAVAPSRSLVSLLTQGHVTKSHLPSSRDYRTKLEHSRQHSALPRNQQPRRERAEKERSALKEERRRPVTTEKAISRS